jgi:hypothetical protein
MRSGNVLAQGRAMGSQDYRGLEQPKLSQRSPWRLDITCEMRTLQGPSDTKTSESLLRHMV